MKAETTPAGGGLNHRIDVYLVTHGQTRRELVEIGGNDYGDIILSFAEGDKVQFTPREKGLSVPTVESVKGVYQNKLPRLSSIRVTGGVIFGDGRIIPRPEHAEIVAAIREEGEATRQNFGEFWQGLLQKFGFIRKRARYPRTSQQAKRRAAEMWRKWPLTCLDAQRGTEKVDCYEHYKKELQKDRIESLEHFKAVIDNARK